MKLSWGDQIETYVETETEENVPEEKGEKSAKDTACERDSDCTKEKKKSQSVYLMMINLILFFQIKE